jgi:hypothetical protein
MQLKIKDPYDIVFEWIPYSQFSNINEIKKSAVYLAMWKGGPLNYDFDKYEYTRSQNTKVGLKYLHNSQSITNKLLKKV